MPHLRKLVAPWSGVLLRHRPATSTRSVLDDTYLGQAADNRWTPLGLRAWYFAVDRGVVAAEHARHIAADLPPGHHERLERDVFRIRTALARTLDLTDPRVVRAMGAEPVNRWTLDLAATQASGAYLFAQVPGLQALIVPSVAFLDDHARHNVVIFRDAVDPVAVFGPPEPAFRITLDAPGGPPAQTVAHPQGSAR